MPQPDLTNVPLPDLTSLSRRQTLQALGLMGSLPLLGNFAAPAAAQARFPRQPVRLIVPFPPGGPVDTIARNIALPLGERWGHPCVVDNRAGAGGIVGAEVAAKQPADGHNLFVAAIHHAVILSLRSKLPYDIEKDFVPVAFGASFPLVLMAHPSLPFKTVAELIAYDKKNPGTLAFGSAGNGGGTHLAGELFNMHTGTRLRHIPYKGSAPAMNDLLGGQVQLMFSDGPTAMPQVKAGRLRALALASTTRSALFPDIPCMAEEGVPNYEAYSWAALFAPKGTPESVIAKINTQVNQLMNEHETRERLLEAGAEPRTGTPQQLGQFLQAEIQKWARVIKVANIHLT